MIRVRKVTYQVHLDRLDENENVIAELSTNEPLTIYPHQFEKLREQVTTIVEQVESRTPSA